MKSRGQLGAIVDAEDSGLLKSIAGLAVTLQRTQGYQTLAQTVGTLDTTTEESGPNSPGRSRAFRPSWPKCRWAPSALAEGSAALAEGVQQLVDQTKKMGGGLNDASDFLLGLKRDADKPTMAGFNIPPEIMTRDEFKKGAQLFLSPDGHAARYFVQSALNPFTTEAMDQVNEIVRVAQVHQAEHRTGGRQDSPGRDSDRRFGIPATITTTTSGSSSSRRSSSSS